MRVLKHLYVQVLIGLAAGILVGHFAPAFGVQMKVLAVIVAVGVGVIATRRTAPLGGAGFLMVALVPSFWYGAAVPYAAATLGIAAYRFMTLWLPLPGALLALPAIRGLRGGSESQRSRAIDALAAADTDRELRPAAGGRPEARPKPS